MMTHGERERPARQATGGAFESRGKCYMRVTVAPRTRPAKLLPWCTSLPDAEARAHVVQALVNDLRAAGEESWIANVVKEGATASPDELAALQRNVARIVEGKVERAELQPDSNAQTTFKAFAMQWVRGELAALYPDYVERKRSAYVDLCYLRKYAFPVLGAKPLADITLEDFERVMRELDGRAEKKLSRATRRQVAQVVRRVMGLAAYPAKLVKMNPIPAEAMPQKRSDVGLQFCYPEEDAVLMRDARAELGCRLLFGFLHRQGPRRAEALGGEIDTVEDAIEDEETFGVVPALTWGRVDLRRGAILPDRNKTGDTTLTPLEPDLVRALKVWKGMQAKAGPDDPVFVTLAGDPIEPRDATDSYRVLLRAALVAADCDRPELWTAGHGRRTLRLHDARASFVTVALVNGRSEDWVRVAPSTSRPPSSATGASSGRSRSSISEIGSPSTRPSRRSPPSSRPKKEKRPPSRPPRTKRKPPLLPP